VTAITVWSFSSANKPHNKSIALATIVGVKAVDGFDAGLGNHYLSKAETLLELAIEFAQERRRND
jgi:hypothetical protein